MPKPMGQRQVIGIVDREKGVAEKGANGANGRKIHRVGLEFDMPSIQARPHRP
jgi:hypothetical protein